MKKCFVLCSTLLSMCLTACGGAESNVKFDNTLPMKKIAVNIDYGTIVSNKVTNTFSADMKIDDYEMFYKKDPTKKVNNLLAGDDIEVYYTSDNYENVDHILVEPVTELVIKVNSHVVPGTGLMDIFVYDENIIIVQNYIQNIINEDGSFVHISEAKKYPKLYGTYKESDVLYENETAYISLTAIYSYKPRIE